MAERPDLEMTVGDLRPSWQPTLRDGQGNLVTLTAPTMLMIKSTGGAPKVNYAAMTIVGPGVARYDWIADDVDTAGDFYAWVRDVDGSSKPWHWPYGGRRYLIRFTAAE